MKNECDIDHNCIYIYFISISHLSFIVVFIYEFFVDFLNTVIITVII